MRIRPLSLLLVLALTQACGTDPAVVTPTPEPLPAPAPPPTPARPTSPHEPAILAAAKDYATTLDIVTTEPDRSPTDCRSDVPDITPKPSTAKTDDSGHGHKLYYLYARYPQAYRAQTGLARGDAFGFRNPAPPLPPPLAQDVGQVIIKEAWTDIALAADAPRPPDRPVGKKPAYGPTTFETYTYVDGKPHAIGDRSALFMMLKVAATPTPDSDNGWVYATLTPDGSTITAAGLLPSCMGCHEHAEHDRLFGPKR